MANWEQLNFQDGIRPLIEQLYFLHDHIIRILTLIMVLVSYIIFFLLKNKFQYTQSKENHNLEIVWTIIPAATLLLIAFPSLRLLYMSEENLTRPLRIKVIGHQWYWSYEYRNFKDIEFDSFIINKEYTFRLLETDNNVIVPVQTALQFFISSTDVLHSWTIPVLGIKADSSPGRLNILVSNLNKPGVWFGQCSEICGANHRFMPISLFRTAAPHFLTWIKSLSSSL